MADDTLKLPWIKLEIPKPKRWDLAAVGALALALGVAAANLAIALGQPPGSSIAGSITAVLAVGQVAVAGLALLALGKTAKQGTIWGNLAAVAAMGAAVSGVLLAAVLWSAA